MAPSGILSLLKPPGMTSHDAVGAVRRLYGERRVGHAGTLDPDAAGVLVVCVGTGTKVIQFMADDDKEYYAMCVLGASTDTLDAGGKVTYRAPDGWRTTAKDLDDAVSAFTGPIQQLPPMVSAVHHEGKRLYQLAREGIEVERTPRTVEIKELSVDSVISPCRDGGLTAGTRFRLRLRCSKGTYVRSLVDDIGQKLGGGAYLEFLVRTASGGFRLEECRTFEEIGAASAEERLQFLLPPETGLRHLAPIHLDAQGEEAFQHGRPVTGVTVKADRHPLNGEPELVRVLGQAGRFLGVGERRADSLRAVRVFV